jgi:hypothetical protein
MGPNWSLAPEQPPADTPGNQRRVDLVVKRWTPDGFVVLLFLEAKKENATQKDIDDVEYQAFKACTEYVIEYGAARMYAMTTIGTAARVWRLARGSDYLEPMTSGEHLSDRGQYIDADSDASHEIVTAIEQIKDRPPPSGSASIHPYQQALGNEGTPYAQQYTVPSSALSTGSDEHDETMSEFQSYEATLHVADSMDIDAASSSKGNRLKLPEDTPHVTVKKVGHTLKKDEYVFTFADKERRSEREDWIKAIIMYKGKEERCMAYRTRSGRLCFTWKLE